MYGNTRRPSGQCAMPSSSTRRGAARVMSSPSKAIRPALGTSTPEIAFNGVVLPAPLAPMRVTSSPLRTSKDSPRTAATLPYRHSSASTVSTRVSLAEVGADYFGVALDLGRGAARDGPSLVQAHDAIGYVHHHLHVVLDEEHGDAERADLPELRHEPRGLHRVHAGDRLVEQQEPRPRGERDCDLEQALLPVGEGAPELVRARAEADELQDAPGLRLEPALLAGDRGQAEEDRERPLRRAQMKADQDVLEHATPAENARLLERAHKAELGDAVGFQAVQAGATEDDLAYSRREIAGDRIERRRLAGAVGADEGENLPLPHLEAQVVDGEEAAEVDRQPLDDEAGVSLRRAGRGGGHGEPFAAGAAPTARSCHRSHHRETAGTMPSGKKVTSSTIATPYTIHWISGLIASARSVSGSSPKISPPTTGPASVPLPPVTTMITMVTV